MQPIRQYFFMNFKFDTYIGITGGVMFGFSGVCVGSAEAQRSFKCPETAVLEQSSLRAMESYNYGMK